MPLTALHAAIGMLDLTQPRLGADTDWSSLHRATPRAPLTCRACGGAMVAKNSKLDNPFFAHLRRPDDCWLAGESIHHRLLKVALAAAVRDAGWHAELEVAGAGVTPWRADVLASAPDGSRRIAFEAQLAAIDAEEITRRSENYAASGVEVCWVSDKPRDWLGAAPYLVVRPGDHAYTAELGLWKFVPDWCENRSRCSWQLYETSMMFRSLNPGSGPLPCPGHGSWRPVERPLAEVVGFITTGQVQVVTINDSLPMIDGRRTWWVRDGHQAWTAPHYLRLRAEQAHAEARHARAEDAQDAEWRKRQANIDALAERQTALRWPACEALGMRHGSAATIRGKDPAWDESWAMGVPVVSVNDSRHVLGVVCPVASRITPSIGAKLARVVIVVASEREQARIAAACWRAQDFLLLTP